MELGIKMSKYEIGEIVIGYVTGIEKYGIFVHLGENYTGLIHISEISNTYIKNIQDYVKIGEKIYVRILDINEDKKQIKLSIKGFDYKMEKNNIPIIQETVSGFSTLKVMLNVWIDKKNKEIMAERNIKN